MRRSVALLLCTTALTPAQARAEPITAFFGGLAASFGATATTAAVAQALGGGALLGFQVGSFLFGSALGQLVLSLGLSAIAQALVPRPNVPSPSDRLVNFAQPVAPMEWAFGTVRKGGPYALTSFQGDRRHYVVILCAHSIDGVEQWYLDQRPVETGTGGDVLTEPYNGAVNLRLHRGATGQLADPVLVAAIPEWTSAHDMAGLASVAAWARRVRDADFATVYGNSPATGPAIAPAFRAADTIYDPRTDSHGWTDNAALVLAWLLTQVLGAQVHWDNVAAEAEIADQLVQNRSGGFERRWTLNGTFDDRTDVAEILKQVIAACDAYLFERPDGTIGFMLGRYVAPTITLTGPDLFSVQISERAWGPQPPTEWVARYVEPDHDWHEAVTATWIEDPDARQVRRDPALYFVTSHNQAMRAIKRIARVERARYTIQAEIGAIGHDLLGVGTGTAHRFVRLQAHGFDLVMEIGRILRTERLGVFRIEGKSVDPADFAFNAATEEPAPPPRLRVTNDNTVAAPTGLAGTSLGGGAVEWTWDAQPPELTQQLRLRRVGHGLWEPSIEIEDASATALSTGLEIGQTYEAELRNLTASRRSSAWVAASPVLVTADPEPEEEP